MGEGQGGASKDRQKTAVNERRTCEKFAKKKPLSQCRVLQWERGKSVLARAVKKRL